MKKTIACMALMVSASSAVAIPEFPTSKQQPITLCLKTYSYKDKSKEATCDAARNNLEEGKKLLANGCAEGQIVIQSFGDVAIESCLPAGVIQL